ncbi:MAG: hypothetical protein ABI675_09745 [Chitinophagaceae bacterium]
MSDRLPYEEQINQQLNDLPLPDENMAWEDMKRRLEEEDDDGIIPIWLRGCGLWGLLLVVLVGIGWWLFRQQKNENIRKQVVIQQEAGSNKKNDEKNESIPLIVVKPSEGSKGDISSGNKRSDNDSNHVNKEGQKNKAIEKSDPEVRTGRTKRTINKIKIEKPVSINSNLKTANRLKKRKQISKEKLSVTHEVILKQRSDNPDQSIKKSDPGVFIDESSDVAIADKRDIDSTISNIKDSAKKNPGEDTVKENNPRKDSLKKRSISFSAGIAMHQLLPVDGQKLTPYNSQGRKGSLADYIPSVFARMYRNEKWFLQLEFRYGAPQYNRAVVYQQENKLDTFNNTNTITSAKLKKTFYHQLPVSFNYFVLPNLSVGGGLVWNKFKGAISEQDIVQRTVSTGTDTVLSKGVILNSKGADSNFAKSYFQALVETQYKWKRFSLGARYSFGLQPYLKFTLPGGTQQNERNRSLQVFLRYELWKLENQ